MSRASDIEVLYDVWEQNIESLRAIHRLQKGGRGLVPAMVGHLRSCAVELVKQATAQQGDGATVSDAPGRIDKSALTIGEPKRIRCKEHLRFVASRSCLICGRSPSHAHHIRYAQSRGLGLKVSDEFTVPLCATHHHQVHATGKEREWWQERDIDPLEVARDLWRESRAQHASKETPIESITDVNPELRTPDDANSALRIPATGTPQNETLTR
jgi:hypothetical protein